MGDPLRRLWDFNDLNATEDRLHQQLESEPDDAGRSELLTQLARVQGLREDFARGEALIVEAEALAGSSAAARVRIDMERGRLLRSGGAPAAALLLFARAYDAAMSAGEEFLAADAAHMAAIAAPDLAAKVDWTRRGMAIAESTGDREVAYWLGPLLNNLGVAYAESGDHRAALDAFERALEARLRFPESPDEIDWARESVEEQRRALGLV